MFKIIYTNRFDKDALRCAKRGLKLDLLKEVINYLEKDGTVPVKYKPHILSGDYKDFWNAMLKPTGF